MIGIPETFVEFNSRNKPIPFRCHVIQEFGVKLNIRHCHLNDPHIIDQLVKPNVIVSDAIIDQLAKTDQIAMLINSLNPPTR